MKKEAGGMRVYGWLLRVLPKAFRREAEPEMVEVFREMHAQARRGGRLSGAIVWMRALLDVLITARAERREAQVLRGRGERRMHWAAVRADVRDAVRGLVRAPGQTMLAAGTLALGIAATSLMLVLVRDVLLRPLPFAEPHELVRLRERDETGRVWWPSFINFEEWREHNRTFDGLAAADVGAVQPVLTEEQGVRARLGSVTADFFALLGVQPVRGRALTADEMRPGGPAAALVSWEFWRSHLESAPPGERTLLIGTERHTVVGVLPPGFRFLGHGNEWRTADVWLSLERAPDVRAGRMSHGYTVVGRLREDLDLERARNELNDLAARLAAEHREPTHAQTIDVRTFEEAVLGAVRTPLRLLLGGAFVVLLIACFNLAATLLARGLSQGRALAVRSALGARRMDLTRHLLAQAAVIAIPGTVLGTVAAALALRAVRAAAPASVPRLHEATLDPGALALTAGVALLCATAAGMLPAMLLAGRDVAQRLRTQTSTDSRSQHALWNTFVAGQVCLALAMVACTTLLVRSLVAASAVDVGFDASGVMIADVSLPDARYAEPARRVAFLDDMLSRLRADPAIESAGITTHEPHDIYTRIAGTRRAENDSLSVFAAYRLVDEGFFETLGIPVQAGALDASADGALIDRFLVDRLWEGRTPIGDQVRTAYEDDVLPVTGVVAKVQAWNVGPNDEPGAMYVHYRRRPERLMNLHVVARGPNTAAVAAALRSAVNSADPLVPVDVASLEARVAAGMGDRRLVLAIAAGFAVVALLLAAIGVYALVAHAAARRMREVGIRMMLGARPRHVRRRILGPGLRAMTFGIVPGIALSLFAVRFVRSQLFGVEPFDPLALIAAVALIGLATWVAATVPAHRATRVDPARLMRED